MPATLTGLRNAHEITLQAAVRKVFVEDEGKLHG
jgi:hypothetical protein